MAAGKAYTMQEMRDVVSYLVERSVYSEVRGRSMWQELASSGRTKRTWQSLKEVFLKRILPDIHNPYYKLSADQVASFRSGTDVTKKNTNRLELRVVGETSKSSDNTNNVAGTSQDPPQQVTGENLTDKVANGHTGVHSRDEMDTIVLDTADDFAVAEEVIIALQAEENATPSPPKSPQNLNYVPEIPNRKRSKSPTKGVSPSPAESTDPSPTKSLKDMIVYKDPLTPMMQQVIGDWDSDSSNASDRGNSAKEPSQVAHLASVPTVVSDSTVADTYLPNNQEDNAQPVAETISGNMQSSSNINTDTNHADEAGMTPLPSIMKKIDTLIEKEQANATADKVSQVLLFGDRSVKTRSKKSDSVGQTTSVTELLRVLTDSVLPNNPEGVRAFKNFLYSQTSRSAATLDSQASDDGEKREQRNVNKKNDTSVTTSVQENGQSAESMDITENLKTAQDIEATEDSDALVIDESKSNNDTEQTSKTNVKNIPSTGIQVGDTLSEPIEKNKSDTPSPSTKKSKKSKKRTLPKEGKKKVKDKKRKEVPDDPSSSHIEKEKALSSKSNSSKVDKVDSKDINNKCDEVIILSSGENSKSLSSTSEIIENSEPLRAVSQTIDHSEPLCAVPPTIESSKPLSVTSESIENSVPPRAVSPSIEHSEPLQAVSPPIESYERLRASSQPINNSEPLREVLSTIGNSEPLRVISPVEITENLRILSPIIQISKPQRTNKPNIEKKIPTVPIQEKETTVPGASAERENLPSTSANPNPELPSSNPCLLNVSLFKETDDTSQVVKVQPSKDISSQVVKVQPSKDISGQVVMVQPSNDISGQVVKVQSSIAGTSEERVTRTNSFVLLPSHSSGSDTESTDPVHLAAPSRKRTRDSKALPRIFGFIDGNLHKRRRSQSSRDRRKHRRVSVTSESSVSDNEDVIPTPRRGYRGRCMRRPKEGRVRALGDGSLVALVDMSHVYTLVTERGERVYRVKYDRHKDADRTREATPTEQRREVIHAGPGVAPSEPAGATCPCRKSEEPLRIVPAATSSSKSLATPTEMTDVVLTKDKITFSGNVERILSVLPQLQLALRGLHPEPPAGAGAGPAAERSEGTRDVDKLNDEEVRARVDAREAEIFREIAEREAAAREVAPGAAVVSQVTPDTVVVPDATPDITGAAVVNAVPKPAIPDAAVTPDTDVDATRAAPEPSRAETQASPPEPRKSTRRRRRQELIDLPLDVPRSSRVSRSRVSPASRGSRGSHSSQGSRGTEPAAAAKGERGGSSESEHEIVIEQIDERTEAPKRRRRLPDNFTDIPVQSGSALKEPLLGAQSDDDDVRYSLPAHRLPPRRKAAADRHGKRRLNKASEDSTDNISIQSSQGYQDTDSSVLDLRPKRNLKLTNSIDLARRKLTSLARRRTRRSYDSKRKSSILATRNLVVTPSDSSGNKRLDISRERNARRSPSTSEIVADSEEFPNLTPVHESVDSVGVPLPGLDEMARNKEPANSSNVSLPPSPEISVVEEISVQSRTIRLYNRTHQTINEQFNTDDEECNRSRRVSIVFDQLDVSFPLMEQELAMKGGDVVGSQRDRKSSDRSSVAEMEICVTNLENSEEMVISEVRLNVTDIAGTKAGVTVTDSLISKVTDVNINDTPFSESLQNELKDLRLNSVSRVVPNDEVQKQTLKVQAAGKGMHRCSTPNKKKKVRKSQPPPIPSVVEEEMVHVECCSMKRRNSYPPAIKSLPTLIPELSTVTMEQNGLCKATLKIPKVVLTPAEIPNSVTVRKPRKPKPNIIKVKILRPNKKTEAVSIKPKRKPTSKRSVSEINSRVKSKKSPRGQSNNSCESQNSTSAYSSTDLIHNHSDSCLLDGSGSKPNARDSGVALQHVSLSPSPDCFSSDAQDTVEHSEAATDSSATSSVHISNLGSLLTEDTSAASPSPSWHLLSEDEEEFLTRENGRELANKVTDEQEEQTLLAKYGAHIASLYPQACAVPDLSTITEDSQDTKGSGDFKSPVPPRLTVPSKRSM